MTLQESTSMESISDPMPSNVSIRKLITVGHEHKVSIPHLWKESLQLGTYLKLTKNTDSIVVESLNV